MAQVPWKPSKLRPHNYGRRVESGLLDVTRYDDPEPVYYCFYLSMWVTGSGDKQQYHMIRPFIGAGCSPLHDPPPPPSDRIVGDSDSKFYAIVKFWIQVIKEIFK